MRFGDCVSALLSWSNIAPLSPLASMSIVIPNDLNPSAIFSLPASASWLLIIKVLNASATTSTLWPFSSAAILSSCVFSTPISIRLFRLSIVSANEVKPDVNLVTPAKASAVPITPRRPLNDLLKPPTLPFASSTF